MIVVPPVAFADAGARVLAESLLAAGGAHPSVALSGGSTPGPVYEALAGLPGLPWEATRIYFADERAVAPDDPSSNYRLARRSLLDRVPIPAESVHRMEAERADLADAAERYERLLPPRLDVLVLGIGTDGHTASLFPRSSNLRESARRVAPAHSPSPPTRRLTITPPVVRSAARIILLARGRSKAHPVHEALLGRADIDDCPARLARGGTWVLDEEAAARLRR